MKEIDFYDKNKLVPLDTALEALSKLSREKGIEEGEKKLLEMLLSSCPVLSLPGGQMFRLSDLSSLFFNFAKAAETNDASFLMQKRGIKVDHVADIQEFVESKYYMGQKGSVRPKIMEELIRLFSTDQYVEVVLSGAIGIGKNYFADMALAYMLYKLSIFHNPQVEYDLAPGSSIVFIQQSIKQQLAKKVVFDQFAARLRESPYFRENFPYDPKINSELRFPNNITILPVGGSDTAAIGMNVFGGVLDELNFMATVKDSTRASHLESREYDQAERLYEVLSRRMKSRFVQKEGKLPGKLLLVSSVNHPKDFTHRKIEEAKTDSTIFIMNYAQWEVLPRSKFSGETFLVEVGNDLKGSRIVTSKEDALDPDDIIEVPTEYLKDFERNIEGALRDLGGIATGVKHPFIRDREAIVEAMQNHDTNFAGKSLFQKMEGAISHMTDPDSPDWTEVIDMDYVDNLIAPDSSVYTMHIDVGVTNDAAGIAVSEITGYKKSNKTKVYDSKAECFTEISGIESPIYTVHGALRLIAPGGGEVDLNMVLEMCSFLSEVINLKWITLDTYQSTMLIQSFRKMRMRSGVLSMDTSTDPYTELKSALQERRILLPNFGHLAKELRELERHTDKVDHPSNGSKDVADAVAGSVYILYLKESRVNSSKRRRSVESRRGRRAQIREREPVSGRRRVRKVYT